MSDCFRVLAQSNRLSVVSGYLPQQTRDMLGNDVANLEKEIKERIATSQGVLILIPDDDSPPTL